MLKANGVCRQCGAPAFIGFHLHAECATTWCKNYSAEFAGVVKDIGGAINCRCEMVPVVKSKSTITGRKATIIICDDFVKPEPSEVELGDIWDLTTARALHVPGKNDDIQRSLEAGQPLFYDNWGIVAPRIGDRVRVTAAHGDFVGWYGEITEVDCKADVQLVIKAKLCTTLEVDIQGPRKDFVLVGRGDWGYQIWQTGENHG